MAYHRGGPAALEVFTTWTDYKKAGPLLFSLDHRGTATAIHCTFSSRMWPSSWRGRQHGWTRDSGDFQAGRQRGAESKRNPFAPGALGLLWDLTDGYSAALPLWIGMELLAAAIIIMRRPSMPFAPMIGAVLRTEPLSKSFLASPRLQERYREPR
jgi:hypothetical protein